MLAPGGTGQKRATHCEIFFVPYFVDPEEMRHEYVPYRDFLFERARGLGFLQEARLRRTGTGSLCLHYAGTGGYRGKISVCYLGANAAVQRSISFK